MATLPPVPARPEDVIPFPEPPPVIYAHNPLESVICQLRFPPVLKIDSEPPAGFQEQVRAEYPILQEITSPFGIGLDLPPGIAKLIGGVLPGGGNKAYEFSSDDSHWKVTLTRESLALTCGEYRRWEEFKGHFARPLDALLRQYNPPFFLRVGLRYRDVIRRSKLGLQETPWGELLNPEIAGEFRSAVSEFIKEAAHILTLRLAGKQAQVLVQHGLGKVDDETCYFIDSDFSENQRTEIIDATKILDYFSRQSYRLFRWCIADALHEAMGPDRI